MSGSQLAPRRRAPAASGRSPSPPPRARPRICRSPAVDQEAAVPARDPVHRDAGPDRQREPPGVGLEVVGHLVLGRERVARGRERHAVEPVEAGRREQAERVPALPPGVADPLVGLEDHERRARGVPGGSRRTGRPGPPPMITVWISSWRAYDAPRSDGMGDALSPDTSYVITTGSASGGLPSRRRPAAWVILCRRPDQVVLVGVRGGRGPGREAQLGEDVAHVAGDGLLADAQVARRSPGWSGRWRRGGAPPARAW